MRPAPAPTHQRKTLIALLGAALALRLGLLACVLAFGGGVDALRDPDTESYLRPARALIEFGTFGPPDAPELMRTPGYPVFLLPGVALGAPEVWAAFVQALLSTATVGLVWALARSWFRQRIAALAAGILALAEPLAVVFSVKVLTETSFTFLVVATVWCLFGRTRRGVIEPPKPGAAAIGGLLLGLAILVRPAGLFLPVVVLGLLALAGLRSSGGIRQLAILAAVAVAAAVPPALWTLRNTIVADYAGVSTIRPLGTYAYTGAAIRAARGEGRYADLNRAMGGGSPQEYAAHHPDQADWTPAMRARWMAAEGSRLMAENRVLAVRIHLRGVVQTALDPCANEALKLFNAWPKQGAGTLARIQDEGALSALTGLVRERPQAIIALGLGGGFLAVAYLLAMVGAVSFRAKCLWAVLVCLAVAGYFLVIAGGPLGVGRLRTPAMPFIVLLAGAGVSALAVRRRRSGRRRSARASGARAA